MRILYILILSSTFREKVSIENYVIKASIEAKVCLHLGIFCKSLYDSHN